MVLEKRSFDATWIDGGLSYSAYMGPEELVEFNRERAKVSGEAEAALRAMLLRAARWDGDAAV